MAAACNNGFPGEFGTVHKEQQGDGGRCQPFNNRNETAPRREERGQQDDTNQGQRKRIKDTKKFHNHS